MRSRMRYAVVMMVFLAGITVGGEVRTELSTQIRMDVLTRTGDDWGVFERETTDAVDAITLHADQWLMYFLHWRPLTENNMIISPKYAKTLLLSFWGPDMPFEIEGVGGDTTVAGHPAVFIDGSIYNGKIQTRFIVWNCEETHRQFISDCNINTGLGTAKKWHRLQFDITDTISCHGGDRKRTSLSPVLHRLFEAKDFNLSFMIPTHWRTGPFRSSKWFPEGMSAVNGSLWTLTTDSQKVIHLRRYKKSRIPSPEFLTAELNDLVGMRMPTGGAGATATLKRVEVSKIKNKGVTYTATGRLKTETTHNGQRIESEYLFRGVMWGREKSHLLLVALIVERDVWGRPFDLRPTDPFIDGYLRREILPAIKSYSNPGG